ncbi:MAG: diguanylate cyclase [Roseiarcus sp.]|jgi:diguanylate cyclase (GGDEF)-like protein
MRALQEKQAIRQVAPERDHGFAVSLMEHLIVPTFVLDAASRVLIWNKACERLTGVQAQEVIGTSDHWRAFYAERRPCLSDLLLARRFNEISAMYANGGSYGLSDFGVSAENWCIMPRVGHRLYLAIDAGPIYDESGDLIAVVETLRDITTQKQAQTDLEALATRDGLTGLANRRSFDVKLAEEAKRACRDQLPLSLLMIDVDCFKLYNDTNGHQMGDECLRAIAQAIAATLWRETDFSARYGGEEFTVIMPNTPLSGGMLIAERLRRAVEDLGIAHSASIACDHVTLSIGGVVAVGRDIHPDRLIAAADAALYRAKRAGRNRAVVCKFDEGAAANVAARASA